MGIKISDMTPDTSIGGSELIPVSDAGTSKSITPSGIKDFTIDSIESIAAGSSVTGSDSIFILQGGALKPVDIDVVAQHAIDTIWGKTAESAPDGLDVIPLKDGGTAEKTVTLSSLATYIKDTIAATILNISSLDTLSSIAGTDVLLVTSGTTAKKFTYTALSAAVYASLVSYVAGLTEVTATTDEDKFFVIQGGVGKYVTLEDVLAHAGSPVTTTGGAVENYIPQWDAGGTGLKAGLQVITAIEDSGSDAAIPTTSAVMAAIDEATTGIVASGSVTENNLVSWATDDETVKDAGIPSSMLSIDTVWIPAAAMTASTTAGATLESVEYSSNSLTHPCMTFAGDTADESAEFNVSLPEAWNRGTIKAKLFWSPDTGANAYEWVKFTLAGGLVQNDGAIDAALGTAQQITDQAIAVGDMHVTDASPAVTVGGTLAAGQMVHFKLTRDYDYAGDGSAMDVDAHVFGILIQYTKSNSVTAW